MILNPIILKLKKSERKERKNKELDTNKLKEKKH